MRNVSLADYYSPEGAWGFGGVGGAQIYQFLMSDPEVRKAMEATATLPKTGPSVSALGVEDLTPILADAEVQEQQLYLWKEIPKLAAHDLVIQTPTMERTNTNRGMTGFVSSNTSGNVSDAQFRRTTQEVKFMAVKGQVTLPTQLVRQVTFTGVRDAAAMQLAETLAMRTLLKLIERNLAYADASISEVEFNGILQQIGSYATVDNRIRLDLRGAAPDKDFLEQLSEIALQNSANPTHFHIPNKVRRDLIQAMFPSQRANEAYNGMVGFNFDKFMSQTMGGDMSSVLIRRNQMMSLGVPDGLPYTPGSSASPNGPDAPSSVTGAGAAHTATDYAPGLVAGTYYYSVEAASEGGASLPTASAGIVPTAAQKVTLSITNTDATAEFFYVFRNPEGVSGVAAANRKFLARVARTGNVTTWDDTGYHVPGTANAMYLSQRETELRFRQLLPPLKRPLPRGLMDDTFGILLFGAVELPVPEHQIWVANIGERDQSGVPSLVS